ncbi:MAG: hypothetical protein WCQ49_02325 [Candidatus Saccharibacteria bacterium]
MQPNQPQENDRQDLAQQLNDTLNGQNVENYQQPIQQPSVIEQPVVAPQVISPDIITNQPAVGNQLFAAAPVVESPISTEPQIVNGFEPVSNNEAVAPVAIARKKSKKSLLIIIICSVLVMIFGGAALAYNFWYSNPDKVMSDAVINAIMAKSIIYTGDIKLSNNDSSLAVSVNASQDRSSGKIDATLTISFAGNNYIVGTSTIIDGKGDIYIKVDKLAAIADQISSMGIDRTEIDKFVVKVNNKWVKVSSSDLASFSGAKDCLTSSISNFKDDKAAIKEITDVYNKSQFIVIDKELGKEDGSFGYSVKGDSEAAKSFVKNVKTTKIYTTLKNCDSNFDISTEDIDFSKQYATNFSNEVWVDSWSHNISKVVLSGKFDETKLSATIGTKFGQPVVVEAPGESIDLKDVLTDLFSVYSSFSQPSVEYTPADNNDFRPIDDI